MRASSRAGPRLVLVIVEAEYNNMGRMKKHDSEQKKSCVRCSTMKVDLTKILGACGSGGFLWALHCVFPLELRVVAWITILALPIWGAKHVLRWLCEAKVELKRLLEDSGAANDH